MRTKYNIDLLAALPADIITPLNYIIGNHNSGATITEWDILVGFVKAQIYNYILEHHLFEVTLPENYTIVLLEDGKPVLTITEVEIHELENVEP
jgi:hypothetical protein